MSRKHNKPTERGPETARVAEFRQRFALALAGMTAATIASPTAPEEAPEITGGHAFGRPRVGALLAAGFAAGLAAAPSPAQAEGRYYPGDLYSVRDQAGESYRSREQAPEWTPKEVERLGDCGSLLSRHYINPSFWWHAHTQVVEKDVYEALDIAIAHPELFYYKVDRDGVIHMIAREPTPSIPEGFEITIRGGEKQGYISQIKLRGKIIPLDHEAWVPWEAYLKTMFGIIEPEINFLMGTANRDLRKTVDVLRDKRSYERMLPHLIARLLEKRKETGYLDPEREDPARNPGMRDFLNRLRTHSTDLSKDAALNAVANPAENPDAIEITGDINPALDPATGLIDPLNMPLTLLALTTDGRIVRPAGTNPSGAPRYEVPGQDGIKSLRQMLIDRYGPRLLKP